MPADYRRVEGDGTTWLMREDWAVDPASAPMRALVALPGRRAAKAGAGRGETVRFAAGGRDAFGKHLLRGGLAGRLVDGLHCGAGRGLRALLNSEALRRAGVPTPLVLAVGWRKVLGPLTTQALVTESIPGAKSVQQALLDAPAGPARGRAILLAADLVRALHGAGFLHGDLNLSNLVLEPAAHPPRALVVDLDRGRFLRGPSRQALSRNLSRLLRSYEKWVAPVSPLRARDAVRFLRRYCQDDRDLIRYHFRRLRRYRSRLILRRLSWRVPVPAPGAHRRQER